MKIYVFAASSMILAFVEPTSAKRIASSLRALKEEMSMSMAITKSNPDSEEANVEDIMPAIGYDHNICNDASFVAVMSNDCPDFRDYSHPDSNLHYGCTDEVATDGICVSIASECGTSSHEDNCYVIKDEYISTSVFKRTPAIIVLEDFETPVWPYGNWVYAADVNGVTTQNAAWEGMFGYLGNYGWYRNTEWTVGNPGDILSMRTRYSGGTQARSYLGFDATSAGTKCLLFASNNGGEIRFQRNTNYGFVELNSVPFAVQVGVWYKLEIEFVDAYNVIGRLFDDTGMVLLAGPLYQFYSEGVNPGNIALRSFFQHQSDYIEYIPAPAGATPSEVPATELGSDVGEFNSEYDFP